MPPPDLSAVRYVDVDASLVTFCSWCRHSEFVHSDRESGLCLFSECKCPRFFPMVDATDHDLEVVCERAGRDANPWTTHAAESPAPRPVLATGTLPKRHGLLTEVPGHDAPYRPIRGAVV